MRLCLGLEVCLFRSYSISIHYCSGQIQKASHLPSSSHSITPALYNTITTLLYSAILCYTLLYSTTTPLLHRYHYILYLIHHAYQAQQRLQHHPRQQWQYRPSRRHAGYAHFSLPMVSFNANYISGPNGGRKAPVVIHQGGQTYDETRPSDWDKQRWK